MENQSKIHKMEQIMISKGAVIEAENRGARGKDMVALKLPPVGEMMKVTVKRAEEITETRKVHT